MPVACTRSDSDLPHMKLDDGNRRYFFHTQKSDSSLLPSVLNADKNHPPRKKVQFNLIIRVILIATKSEYDSFRHEVWWTAAELKMFRQDAHDEIREVISRLRLDYQTVAKSQSHLSMLFLYKAEHDAAVLQTMELLLVQHNCLAVIPPSSSRGSSRSTSRSASRSATPSPLACPSVTSNFSPIQWAEEPLPLPPCWL